MYPWICGRCASRFTRANLSELTVHRRNHDHDYNPPDGSNWELLCVYCHDNEHSRHIDHTGASASKDLHSRAIATGNPFADPERNAQAQIRQLFCRLQNSSEAILRR